MWGKDMCRVLYLKNMMLRVLFWIRQNFQPDNGCKSQVRLDPPTGRAQGHYSTFWVPLLPQQLDLEKYLDSQGKGFCPSAAPTGEELTLEIPRGNNLGGRPGQGRGPAGAQPTSLRCL